MAEDEAEPTENKDSTPDRKDLEVLRESGLTPKEIQLKLGLNNNVQYYNVWSKGARFKPARSRILRRLANQVRKKIGRESLPEEPTLNLDQGTPIEITSKELDIRILKEIITGKEKRWVVEITLNEEESEATDVLS